MRNRIAAAAMTRAHYPRTPKAELGESQVLDQPGLQRKCRALSIKRWWWRRRRRKRRGEGKRGRENHEKSATSD